jgi:hypothetical protein
MPPFGEMACAGGTRAAVMRPVICDLLNLRNQGEIASEVIPHNRDHEWPKSL